MWAVAEFSTVERAYYQVVEHLVEAVVVCLGDSWAGGWWTRWMVVTEHQTAVVETRDSRLALAGYTRFGEIPRQSKRYSKIHVYITQEMHSVTHMCVRAYMYVFVKLGNKEGNGITDWPGGLET